MLRYLHEHIPLSRAMEVRVEAAAREAVELSAPFGPNVNHRATAFGGSVSALAILAGWTWVHLRRGDLAAPVRIVIQRNRIEYREPVDGTFRARVLAPDPGAWAHLVTATERWGRGRIALQVAVLHGDERRAADFRGAYVAIRADDGT